MNILEIVQLLEETMNNRLDDLVKLGKACKQLLKKKRLKDSEKESITYMRIEMGRIVKELQPVKGMILDENPQYTDLFDALITFYDDYTAKNKQEGIDTFSFLSDKNRSTQEIKG